ncbi:S53 family peptidase (plasmid) [Rhizobium sp. CB3171]|uniref:S53 family peptidase n=1 Tax=Rhizobium sp. CB3171 TaxID=3039157 RepID=UPI0024B182A5|nr:S53 family peptidase [Rhizobium sp. CB3171]WFU07380.1 S53 family peptidase [Rhizobium sp. CB3171]
MTKARSNNVLISDSARAAPDEQLVGELDADATLRLTIYFRRRSPALPIGSAEDLARLQPRLSRTVLERQRARTHKRAAARISGFLRDRGIVVQTIDYTSRKMEIEAPAHVLTQLFQADIRLYSDGEHTFRARTGSLSIPRPIAPWVRAVVGFDQRPLPTTSSVLTGDGTDSLWPTNVAELYGVPLDHDLSRQCVGIVALGGGYLADDLRAALSAMGRTLPEIVEVHLNGATGVFGADARADEEIALDLQVLAALVPAARIVIYFAENSQQALSDALDKAVHDSVNDPRVISVSWGAAEVHWTAPRREVLNAILCDAVRLGVSVVAAAGDDLATCNEPDGKAHVWFPASSPYVLSCGGTSIKLQDNAIAQEAVWNTGIAGTGGGVSEVFPVPAYQAHTQIPLSVSTGLPGRGVPDVSALASETPGYRIIVEGTERNLGGTSAATPLWAGCLAITDSLRAQSIGFAVPALYAQPRAMRSVLEGDNFRNGIGYKAGAGWSACAGLGTPIGTNVIEILTAASEGDLMS